MEKPNEFPEAMFRRTLHMDEKLARALTVGGIATLEEPAYIPIGELLGIQRLQESEAQLFRERARAYLLNDALGDENAGDAVDALYIGN